MEQATVDDVETRLQSAGCSRGLPALDTTAASFAVFVMMAHWSLVVMYEAPTHHPDMQ